MLGLGKIIGLPLKIYITHSVHIPVEYLRYYGVSESSDMLSLNISKHSLFYRPLRSGEPGPEDIRKPIRTGLIALPTAWLRQNGLEADDFVFLLGTVHGLLIYADDKITL